MGEDGDGGARWGGFYSDKASREAAIQEECKILEGFWELSMVKLKDLGRD